MGSLWHWLRNCCWPSVRFVDLSGQGFEASSKTQIWSHAEEVKQIDVHVWNEGHQWESSQILIWAWCRDYSCQREIAILRPQNHFDDISTWKLPSSEIVISRRHNIVRFHLDPSLTLSTTSDSVGGVLIISVLQNLVMILSLSLTAALAANNPLPPGPTSLFCACYAVPLHGSYICYHHQVA